MALRGWARAPVAWILRWATPRTVGTTPCHCGRRGPRRGHRGCSGDVGHTRMGSRSSLELLSRSQIPHSPAVRSHETNGPELIPSQPRPPLAPPLLRHCAGCSANRGQAALARRSQLTPERDKGETLCSPTPGISSCSSRTLLSRQMRTASARSRLAPHREGSCGE